MTLVVQLVQHRIIQFNCPPTAVLFNIMLKIRFRAILNLFTQALKIHSLLLTRTWQLILLGTRNRVWEMAIVHMSHRKLRYKADD